MLNKEKLHNGFCYQQFQQEIYSVKDLNSKKIYR